MNKKTSGLANDFVNEARKRGEVKSLAGAVGMPDKEDYDNICNIIALYRKESIRRYGFDILVDAITTARREHDEFGGKYENKAKGFNLVNKDSNMRYNFELPESLIRAIELAYPLMFTDLKHYTWFCKNFKALMISERF